MPTSKKINFRLFINKDLTKKTLEKLQSEKRQLEKNEITPFVKSLKIGTSLPSNLDEKKEYRQHLSDKYK